MALDRLVLDQGQPRRTLDAEALARLKASMAANGLIQPIVVAAMQGRSDRFRIVAGWRRAEAATQLGWTSIDAVVVSEATPLAQAAENTARAGLSTAELMGVIAQTHADGRRASAIAGALGVSDRLVRYYLAVLEHPDLVEAVANGMSLRAAASRATERRKPANDPATSTISGDVADASPADRRRRRRARAAVQRLASEWAGLDDTTRAELADRLSTLVDGESDPTPRGGATDPGPHGAADGGGDR